MGRMVQSGGWAGLVMAFTAAVGMVESLDSRLVIHPVLSLGYLMLLWIVPLAGYRAGKTPELEGLVASPKGFAHVLAGLGAGLIAGFLLAVFVLIVDTVDSREVFVSFSPRLVDLLTAGRGIPSGLALAILVPTLLGGLGGGAHLLQPSVRKRLVYALGVTATVAILEGVFDQIMREIGLGGLAERLFTRHALEWWAALGVATVAFVRSQRTRQLWGRVRSRLTTPDHKERIRVSLWLSAPTLVVVILLPQLLGSLLSEILANVGLFLLMGLGLNIVVGVAGMLDLGYVAFFAVGAYTMGVLTSPISPRFSPELSWWAALPFALLVSAGAGILVGLPVLRMRGDYLAIVTLGFGEIVRILVLSDWLSPTFGGAQGIQGIPGIPLGVTEVSGVNPEGILYFAFGFTLIAAWVSWSLQRSRIGRAWNALREDETVAEAMGINIVLAKLNAFIIGAVMAGLAGALFAAKLGSIFPSSFELLVSIIILVVVIVGGMGNIVGVAVGALVLIGILGGPNVPGLLAEFAEFKLLIYGALLVVMMLMRPAGLLPSVRRSRELHPEEISQDAWLDRDAPVASTVGRQGPA